jgi:poly-gamma-glutamate synthesis protein (capsule biosynthesis protein)
MSATLALAGDTMLGRGVAERLNANPAAPLFAPEIAEHIAGADAFVLNLECCISDRGSPFPEPGKPFFFRAPPVAAQHLAELGVDAVTLANNHALDYGADALLDTLSYLEGTGIATVGAGANEETAREPRRLRCGDVDLQLISFSDHPASYAAGPERPGIAFADLRAGLPSWLERAMVADDEGAPLVVSPHWGPNMVVEPVPHVRRTAHALMAAGATLIAGHSAHVFQGVAERVLVDLGDFLDDYAVNRELRNDLSLLWFVEWGQSEIGRVRAVPLALDYCFTRPASDAEQDWILRRLRALCAGFGTEVEAHEEMIEFRTGAFER